MKLEQYSFGIGDRFGMQGRSQLNAIKSARKSGKDIAIVWTSLTESTG